MANYTIIGGDSKEYGPVTAEEIRQWIAEGRLNEKSLVREEKSSEWRPLASFPELSAVPRPLAPPPIGAPQLKPVPADLSGLRPAAICLILFGGLSVLVGLYDVVNTFVNPPTVDQIMNQLSSYMPSDPETQRRLHDPQFQSTMRFFCSFGFAVFSAALSTVTSAIILWGSVRMLSGRNYELACLAAILAMIPCFTPCCCVGLPLGAWALTVLRKPEIKGLFH